MSSESRPSASTQGSGNASELGVEAIGVAVGGGVHVNAEGTIRPSSGRYRLREDPAPAAANGDWDPGLLSPPAKRDMPCLILGRSRHQEGLSCRRCSSYAHYLSMHLVFPCVSAVLYLIGSRMPRALRPSRKRSVACPDAPGSRDRCFFSQCRLIAYLAPRRRFRDRSVVRAEVAI